jgi:5-methylcytosine-specific restriction endonuclease McrA
MADYYQANREKLRAATAANRAANPEAKRQYDSEYSQRENYVDYQRIYRCANREQLRRQQRHKYATDMDYRLQRQLNAMRRRVRMANVQTIPFTVQQLRRRLAYWNNCCWICGDPATAIDHVKPLAKGGAHMLCNFRPICQPCNNMKRDKWPLPSRAAILGLVA